MKKRRKRAGRAPQLKTTWPIRSYNKDSKEWLSSFYLVFIGEIHAPIVQSLNGPQKSSGDIRNSDDESHCLHVGATTRMEEDQLASK